MKKRSDTMDGWIKMERFGLDVPAGSKVTWNHKPNLMGICAASICPYFMYHHYSNRSSCT